MSRSILTSISASLLLLTHSAWSAPLPNELPSGGQVVAGQANISQTGSTMNINQTSNNAAVNWGSFNVGRDAVVNFNQPSSNSVTLNRVQNGNASQIFGQINANGQVFLTNPNGVYFAPGASVNVGGLVATTHKISNEDFMEGNYHFKRNGATGSIINEAELNASIEGYIALLAPEVRNQGVIVAYLGTVALAAGESYQLQIDSNGSLTNLQVEPATIETLVDNGNAVRAEGGLIILSAQSINALQGGVINSTGELEATSISSRNGRIILGGDEQGATTVSGLINVSSDDASGGDITVTGKDILIKSTAKLLATGKTGGGKILVGGSYQNTDTTIDQAVTTTIEKGAVLDASATVNGDGGSVVAWSDITNVDSVTRVAGSFFAKGGVEGGDGGNIETSGAVVDFEGITLSAGAGNGQNGLWLIDPTYGHPVVQQLDASAYTSALNGGTDVTNLVSGDITVNNGILINKTTGGDATLTFKATQDVFVGSDVVISSTSGKLNIVLWSDSDNSDAGSIVVDNRTAFSSNGGYIYLGGGSSVTTDYADDGGRPHGILIGTDVVIDAQGGDISLRGSTANGAGFGIQQYGTVKTSGTGTIVYDGLNVTGGENGLYGVYLLDSAFVQSGNGAINITAQGANSGTGTSLVLDDFAQIQTTGSGDIIINAIRTSLTPVPGNEARIDLNSVNSKISSTGGGSIFLKADDLQLDGLLQSSGQLSIDNWNGTIEIGADSGNSFMSLPLSYFSSNFINGFSSINIGSFFNSTLTTSGVLNTNDPLKLTASRSIQLGGNITTNNNSLTLAQNYDGSTISSSLNLGTGDLILHGGFSGIIDLDIKQLNYTGNTSIASGTVRQLISQAIPAATNLTVDGTFDLNGKGNLFVGSLAGNGTVKLGANSLTTNNNNSTTFSGVIADTGGLIKQGSGVLILSGINTYTGDTTINGGTLQTGINNALSNSTDVIVNSGSYDLNDFSDTIATLSGTGSVKLGSGTLTTGNATSQTFSGVISETGNLIKNGTGTFTLSGINTYTGNTTINTGTLQAGTNNILSNSTDVIVNSGSSYDLNNFSDTIATLSGAGSVKLGSATLTTGNATSQTFSGVISETGSLIKNGSGVLTLSGVNTYTGDTTVNGGTLRAGTNNILSNSTDVIVNSGSSYDLNNFSDTIGSLAGAGNVLLGAGTLTTGANNTNTIFSGVISETGNLTKSGNGTFTLSGNNSYTGSTTINSGSLKVGNGGSSGTLGTGNIIDNSLLYFNRSGSAFTVSNTISGTGQLRKQGSASLTLSGNNSYSGSTNIEGGTLVAATSTALGNASGATSINSGAVLDLKSVAIGSESVSIFGTGILNVSSGNSSLSGSVYLDTTSEISVANGAQLTLSGKISEYTYGKRLEKTGAGKLILTNNSNDYTYTTVSSGTLQVGNGGTSGKLGTGSVINNANLLFNRSGNISLSTISGNITGTGHVTAQIGGSLNVDRTITLTGSSSDIVLAAGYNVAAATATGGDVSLSSNVTTSSGGTVTIFSGNPNTTTLNNRIIGATGATKYKAYNRSSSAISGAVSGTRNFYYRSAPTLTISGLTATKTYDGNTSAVGYTSGGTISGEVESDSYLISDLTATSLTFNDKNVGSKTLNATHTANTITSGGYRISGYQVNSYAGASSGTINAKIVSLGASKVYDGTTTLSGADVIINTGVLTETLSYSGATVNDSHVVTANKFINAITLANGNNGGLASNYQLPTLNVANAPVTITAKTLTPTVSNTGVTKVYDAASSAPSGFIPTYTYSGFVSGDSDAALTHSGSAYNSAHVANANKVTVSGMAISNITGDNGSLASDYALSSTSKDVAASITTKTLTSSVSNTGVTKIYDGTISSNVTPTYNLAGFIFGDTAATLSNTEALYDSTHVANASLVTVSGLAVTGITGSNGSLATDYSLDASTKDVAATITAKSITPSTIILDANKIYDGTTASALSPTYTFGGGLVAGDSAAALSHVLAEYDSKDVISASKVTLSGLSIASIAGSNSSATTDYTLTTNSLDVTGSIKPLAVGLSANKIYDGGNSLTNAVSITTGVAGETLSYSGATSIATHVESLFNYVNAITLQNDGATLASNYKLPILNNTFAPVTITPKTLTPSITNVGVTKSYDGTTSSSFTPTYSFTGLVSGDTQATLSHAEQLYDSAHVANASLVTVSGLAVTGITGSNGSLATDYSLDASTKDVAATITAKSITPSTIILDANKIYDGTTASALSPTYTFGGGLVAGDSAAALSHVLAEYDSKDVISASKVTLSGLSIASIAGSNSSATTDYTLTTNSLDVTGSIKPLAVGLSANKIYDGGNSLTNAVSITTGVAGETLSYSGATSIATHVESLFNYVNAITLQNDGATLASNYKLPILNNTFAPVTITPKTLTPSITNVGVTKSYDGTTSSSFTPTYSFTGLVSGDTQATLSHAEQLYDSAHVADVSFVTVSGLAVTSVSGSNGSQITDYVLDAYSKSVTATITPAVLTPTVTNVGVTKAYDGATSSPIGFVPSYTYSGLVSGDTHATLSHAEQLYDNAHVAEASLIAVSGLAITDISGSNSSQVTDYVLDASSKNVAATISPIDLVVTANIDSKTFDGLAYSGGNGVSYFGFITGESSGVLGGALSFAGDSQGAINPGSYTVTPEGFTSSDYLIGYEDGYLTIIPVIPPPIIVNIGPTSIFSESSSISVPKSLLDSSTSGVSVTLENMSELSGNRIIAVTVPEGSSVSGAGFSFPLPEEVKSTVRGRGDIVKVSMPSGELLPEWLAFDSKTLIFTAGAVPDQGLPMEIFLTVGSEKFTVIISERAKE